MKHRFPALVCIYSPLAKGSTEGDFEVWKFRATKYPPCVFWTTLLVTFFPENIGKFCFSIVLLQAFSLKWPSSYVTCQLQKTITHAIFLSCQLVVDFKTGCLLFPPLFATVRHRSLSFCFQLVIQVQPSDSFFLQLHFQEKTKSWLFSKLSMDCLRVRSESTPPAAGTLSKKGEIEQNTPQSRRYRPADKQGGTWPWKGMHSTKSRWR